MHLALYQDEPPSQASFDRFVEFSLLDRLKALDYKICRKGLAALDPNKNALIGLGMEIAGGRVTRNGYGVLTLPWRARNHPEWPEVILAEVENLRAAIRKAHGAPLRYLICAGPGGWGEDKLAFKGAGLLKRGPRCYVLDSDSPGRLTEILDDLAGRAGTPLAQALKSALIVGPSTGNVERLAALYRSLRIDSRANFLRLELPSDMLVARHAAPLTRSSLYPLGLAKADLRSWIEGAWLTEDEVRTIWRLAAFLHAQGHAGRVKLTLLLPRIWAGAAQWTRRAMEECLATANGPALYVIADDPVRLANYHRPKDALQDRIFLAVQVKGMPGPESGKAALLRRMGYPVALVTFERGAPLSKFMQSIHYLAFGTAWLRNASFIAEPAANRQPASPDPCPHSADWRGSTRLNFCHLPRDIRLKLAGLDAPCCYAVVSRSLAERGQIDFCELAVADDVRYSQAWRGIERCLERAAEKVFRSRLKMPARIRGEVGMPRRGVFLTVIAGSRQATSGDGNVQILVALRGTSETTIDALDSFFNQAAAQLKRL